MQCGFPPGQQDLGYVKAGRGGVALFVSARRDAVSYSHGWKHASCVLALRHQACPCHPGRLVGTTGRRGFPAGMQASVSLGAAAPRPMSCQGEPAPSDNRRRASAGALQLRGVPPSASRGLPEPRARTQQRLPDRPPLCRRRGTPLLSQSHLEV